MAEAGVNIINGTDGSVAPSRGTVSRSQSPNSRKSVNGEDEEKPKKFQNGWSREQERLMAEWSDIASCYRWLHDKSEKFFHTKTLWINLPVIVLSTLGGTANFGIQSLFENDENAKKYASFAIGGISLFAGLLTTVGNYLRYAQLEESHRVAAIAWGKFQRLIAVELALKPDDRMDSLDFLKICRADLDRLIEQSPPIPKESIVLFEKKFGTIKDLKKIDLLIVDGPPGSKNPEARYPAFKEFKDKLSSKAIIIIDDVNRDGERKLAEDFAKSLPNHTLTILDHEKGTAVISPR
jgi:hypothetical protein